MNNNKLIETVSQKNFTDRVQERNVFLDALNNNQKKIINYHGMGGIGKTSLIHQLIKEIENDKNLYNIYIDIENYAMPINILYSIRNILTEKYNIKFRKFDPAIIAYYSKTGKSQNSPEIKGLMESSVKVTSKGNKVLNLDIFRLFGDFISNISLPAFLIERTVEKIIEVGQNKNNKDFISYLATEVPEIILSNLPQYLAEDINNFLEKKNVRMLFFIDTFEKLDSSQIGSNCSITKLKWLYNTNNTGLMNLIDDSLWVIASREEINSIKNIQNIELTKFDEQTTIEYLHSAGISDKGLCSEIFNNYSEGLPLILSTYIDCFNINSQEFSETNFLGSSEEIIERLIGSLDIDSKAIVYFLACLKNWDDNLVKELAPKCLSQYSELRYAKIKRLSFISKQINTENFIFDKTIRDILLNANLLNDEGMKNIVDKTYEILSDYYVEIIKSKESSTVDKLFAMNEYVEINKNIDYDFIKPFIIELESNYLFIEELELFEKIDNNLKDEIIKNDIMKNKIHIYQMIGMYDKQEELAIIYNKKNNNKQSKEILANSYMYNGNYTLSYNLLVELLKENNEDMNIIKQLADVESRLGKYQEALANYVLIKNNFDRIKNSIIDKDLIVQNIARTYSFMGEYEKSIELLKQILKIDGKDIINELSNNIENITIKDLNIYNDIALSYSNADKLEEALKIKNILLQAYEKYLGKNHPYYLNIKNDIAMIYSHSERHQEAIQMLQDVYEKRKEILGEIKPSTVATLNNLGTVKLFYGKSNNNIEFVKQAFDDLNKAYNMRKEILGEQHPNTINSLFNLILSQYELGKRESIQKNAEIVYNYRRAKLGENHRDTRKAYELLTKIKNNRKGV